MRVIQDQRVVLAHWIYTREEWRAFVRWEGHRQGMIYYLAARFFPKRQRPFPEITITGQKVLTNDIAESFMDQFNKLKRVNIRDTGSMNILEITYEKVTGSLSRLKEIRIPVPKGKLREAVEVYDCLMGNTF